MMLASLSVYPQMQKSLVSKLQASYTLAASLVRTQTIVECKYSQNLS